MPALRRTAAVLAVSSSLLACGGGGGGDGGNATSPLPPVDTTPPPTATIEREAVTLAGLAVGADSILAQTAPKTTTLASALGATMKSLAWRGLSLVAPTAFAAAQPSLDPGANFGFTNRIVDGRLVGMSVRLRTRDGRPTACKDDTAEVQVLQSWKVVVDKNHVLVKVRYPSMIEADCRVSAYTDGIFAVIDGNTVDLAVDGDAVAYVIEAGDQAFNTSSRAVVVYTSGMIRELAVGDDGTAVLTDLSASVLPLKSFLGAFAYDGTRLVGLPTDRNDVVLAFTKGSTAFRLLANTDPALPPSGYGYNGVMLDPAGNFIWMDIGPYKMLVDFDAGTLAQWEPVRQLYASTGPEDPPFPIWTYSVRGRWGTKVLDDRGTLWDYATGSCELLTQPDDRDCANIRYATSVQGSAYSRLTSDGIALAAIGNANIFTRVDLKTGEWKTFNTDTLGFYFGRDRSFNMYKDRVMLWDAVSTSNSDVRIVELNFDSGAVVDHGVVVAGNRQVVRLIPIGN